MAVSSNSMRGALLLRHRVFVDLRLANLLTRYPREAGANSLPLLLTQV
jgi:hypothetical protein